MGPPPARTQPRPYVRPRRHPPFVTSSPRASLVTRRTGVLNADDMEHMFNRAPVPIYQVRFHIFETQNVSCEVESHASAAPQG